MRKPEERATAKDLIKSLRKFKPKIKSIEV